MTAPTPLYRDFASSAQIDAQYNAGAAVPDAADQLRGYTQRAEQARKALRSTLDIPFGPTHDETLDIFPAEQPNAPVFVFLHGGYWRALSSKDFSGVALGLQPLGITTVVVNYSLCPKVTIDEITRQTRAAVAWTLRHIGEYGGDPSRVAVGGHSAGGHLTAMCLLARWAEDYGLPADPIKAALLVSGVYDIEPLRHSYLQPQIRLDDGIVERNSPLFQVRPCRTPALVTWGGDESSEFARQSSSFADAWEASGNRCERLAQPGANHFTAIAGFDDPHSALCRWLVGALKT
ncbi:MAG: alpha/beta hydrolase [Burkholderiaceae bacterium]